MDKIRKYMDKKTTNSIPVYYEQKFRTPLKNEKAMGLWIDRIGARRDYEDTLRMRVLGQYAAVYVESGNGWFVSPQTGKITLKAGQVFFIFPQEPCCYRPVKNWFQRWIVWSGPESQTLENLGYISKNRRIINHAGGIFVPAFEKLSAVMHREDAAAVLERKTVLLEMLLGLLKAAESDGFIRKSADPMQKAVEMIMAEADNMPESPAIARRLHISTTHFRRLFRKYTGSSPTQFHRSLQITRAKQMLSSGMTIKQTAGLLGYKDVFYFMRIFKKTTGLPPGKFIRSAL